jgi:hypothetical protein
VSNQAALTRVVQFPSMKEIQITIMDTGDFEVVSRGTTQTFPAAKVTEREEIALFTKQCPRCEEQLEAVMPQRRFQARDVKHKNTIFGDLRT